MSGCGPPRSDWVSGAGLPVDMLRLPIKSEPGQEGSSRQVVASGACPYIPTVDKDGGGCLLSESSEPEEEDED
jgi:hypothetical protein